MEGFAHSLVAKHGVLPPEIEKWLTHTGNGQYITELCSNPSLGDEAWFELASKKLTVDQAVALVEGGMPEGGLEAILTGEKRKTVLTAACRLRMDFEQLTSVVDLVGGASGPHLLDLYKQLAWWRAEGKDVNDHIVSIWSEMPAKEKLTTICDELVDSYGSALCDDEIVDFLCVIDDAWGKAKGFYRRSQSIKFIVGHKPELMERFVTAGMSSGSVATAVAGSRHLTDLELQARLIGIDPQTGSLLEEGALRVSSWTLMALVNNPVCHGLVSGAVKKLCSEASEDFGLAGRHAAQVRDACRVRKADDVKAATVTEPFEAVSNLGTLNWLVKRCTSYESPYQGSKSQPPRHHDLAALALNPNLGEYQGEGDNYVSKFQVRKALTAIRKDLGSPTSELARVVGQVAWAKAHLALNERVEGSEMTSDVAGFDHASAAGLWPLTWFRTKDTGADWPEHCRSRGFDEPTDETWQAELEAVAAGTASYHSDPVWLLPAGHVHAWPKVPVPVRESSDEVSEQVLAEAHQYGASTKVASVRFTSSDAGLSAGLSTRAQLVVAYVMAELAPVLGDDVVKWEAALAVFNQMGDDPDRSIEDLVRTVKRLNAAAQS